MVILSVSIRSVTNYLSDIEKNMRAERKEKIADMYLSCHTLDEISEATGATLDSLKKNKEWCDMEKMPKSTKLLKLDMVVGECRDFHGVFIFQSQF